MTAPQAYNYWLNNQLVIPEVMRTPVVPPVVPQQQVSAAQLPQYYQPRPVQQYMGDSEGGNPPGISAPYSGGALTGLNNARTLGLGGMGASLVGGVPGFGLLGAGIGAAADAANANEQAMNSYGVGGISGMSAFGNAITGGLLGNSAAGQLSDLGYEASFAPNGMFGTYGYEPDNATALTMADLQAMQGAGGGETPGGYDAGSDYGAATTAAEQEAAMAEGSAPEDGADGAGDDSVICSELYRQGYLCADWYRADAAYGAKLYRNDVYVMVGYHAWGRAVVRGMRRSKALTQVVRLLAMPVIKEIAARGGGSLFGSLVGKAALAAGMPLCRFIGRHAAKGHTAAA